MTVIYEPRMRCCRVCGQRMLLWRWRWAHRRCATTQMASGYEPPSMLLTRKDDPMTDETTPALIAWLRAQLNDDERWARAASQTYRHAAEGTTPPATGVHWRWVAGENWETVTPDPATMDFVEGPGGQWSANLATVEQWPSTTEPTWMMPRTYATEITEMDPSAAGHIIRHDPARVLAEVDAKRRIVAHIGTVVLSPWPITLPDGYAEDLGRILRLLALPYADRPGYREEWRP